MTASAVPPLPPAFAGGDRALVTGATGLITARLPGLPGTLGASITLLDDATPPLGALVAQIAGRIGVRAPRRHVSLRLARLLLRMGLAPGGAVRAESLAFVTRRRYGVTTGRAVASELGLAWPDLGAALARYTDFVLAARPRGGGQALAAAGGA